MARCTGERVTPIQAQNASQVAGMTGLLRVEVDVRRERLSSRRRLSFRALSIAAIGFIEHLRLSV